MVFRQRIRCWSGPWTLGRALTSGIRSSHLAEVQVRVQTTGEFEESVHGGGIETCLLGLLDDGA